MNIATTYNTVDEMVTTLEDARFFFQQLEPLCRGSEAEQATELPKIRRYFRAFLHCLKCVQDYAFDAANIKQSEEVKKKMREWWNGWPERMNAKQRWDYLNTAYDDLRMTRDTDTHRAVVLIGDEIKGEGTKVWTLADGTAILTDPLVPIVVFQPPGKHTKQEPREICSCACSGLEAAERMIADYREGTFPPT